MRKSLLAKRLAGLGETFTVDELRAGTGMSSGTLKKFLHRLESQGWVERIERGKYMLLPLGAAKGSYTLNEFVIGSMLAEPHCIAYWSALHHHGFTEQIPSMVFIQTTSRKKNRNPEIFGIRYRIIRIIPEKFFGQRKERFGDTMVNITDREKTLIDCLDKPQYCGGLIEATKGLNGKEYDPCSLVDYAKRMGNTGVIRRLGFINEHFCLGLDIPALDKNVRNYLLLDPTMPENGQKNGRWRLSINLSDNELEETR